MQTAIEFIRSCATNWDCDADAHKYGTPCRACDAAALLTKLKWSYEELNAKFNQVFDRFNPAYPKSIAAPGFAEAWADVLQEAGWTSAEWSDAVEDHWCGVAGIGPESRKIRVPNTFNIEERRKVYTHSYGNDLRDHVMYCIYMMLGADKDLSTRYFEARKNSEKGQINVLFQIDGIDFDFEKMVNMLWERLSKTVDKRAQKLVDERIRKVTDELDSIYDEVRALRLRNFPDAESPE